MYIIFKSREYFVLLLCVCVHVHVSIVAIQLLCFPAVHYNQKIHKKVSEIAQGILSDNIIYDNDMIMVMISFSGYYCPFDLHSPLQGSLLDQSGLIFVSWLIK